MKPCFLMLAMLSFPTATAQTIIGTVQKIDKDQLQVKSSDGPVTFQVDEKTTVTKSKKLHDLSLLAVGDEIRVNYYGEGTLTAVNISAKVTLAGSIVEAVSSRLTVVPDSTAGAAPEDRKSVTVYLGPATKYGTSRKHLTVGRRVHVVGWDVGDRVIDADKVAVYESDVPVRY